VAVCPSCGQENADGFRFCGVRGGELDAEAPAGVRKTVTVLFCDLVGPTSIGDRADPELLRELRRREETGTSRPCRTELGASRRPYSQGLCA